MKCVKKNSIVVHAVKMLVRNWHNYAMLSVTIVMSFSLLLGYLSFLDSDLFNRYKVILSSPRDVVMAYSWGKTEVNHKALEIMAERTDASVQMYQYHACQTRLSQYGGNVGATLYFLPSGDFPVHEMKLIVQDEYMQTYLFSSVLQPVFGKSNFTLQGNEVMINESFFYVISPDSTLPVSFAIPIEWADGTSSLLEVKVVGVFEDTSTCKSVVKNEKGELEGNVQIYLSQAVLGDYTVEDFLSPGRITWISTQHPNELADYAREQGLVVHSISKCQDEALVNIRAQKATKGIIAIVLLLLLGINLYSSFSNALNERKFEIGVKRALGASAKDIILQFLLESIMIMLINILLSVVIVTECLAGYKLYQLVFKDVQWIINVSGYTVAMFAICSVTLTVVFSLLFAYKAAKVEIVRYLKAE